MYQEHSAGAVIFRTDSSGTPLFLVLKYIGGHWDFAKGHIESGEEALDTVYREVSEETGISHISIIDGFEEKIAYTFTADGKTISKDVVFFLAETDEESITLSEEHRDSAWLSYDQAHNRLTYANAQRVLELAQQHLTRS